MTQGTCPDSLYSYFL